MPLVDSGECASMDYAARNPQPYISRPRAIWRFSDLTQRTEGTRKHSHAHRWALEEKPPAAVVPAGKLDPIGLGTGPLARLQRCPLLFARPQADLGLPSSRHGPGPSRAPAAAHQLFL